MAIATSTALLIAASAAVFAGGISAYSSYQQGQAQSRMANYNALIARQNADLMKKKMDITKIGTGIEETKFRKRIAALKGAQRTAYAKAGVAMEGTPLYVAAETEREADIDALAIRYAGSIEQSQLLAGMAEMQQREKIERMRGKQYATAGYLGAGASLLSGISQGAGYMGMRK